MAASELTQEHFASLLEGDWLKKIVDHKNYNPRVIASISSDCLDEVAPEDYPTYVYNALQNPNLIWSKPYRMLSVRSQNLLVSLFFGSQYNQGIDELRGNFADMHRAVCSNYGQPTDASDFEESLRSLESGFIAIEGSNADFINPSLRDFLKAHLVELDFLLLLPETARRVDWAERLWTHAKAVFEARPDELKTFSKAFEKFALGISELPTYRKIGRDGLVRRAEDDLCVSERVDLLLQWWECSKQDCFLEKAVDVLRARSVVISTSRDGPLLPEVHWWVLNFVDEKNLNQQKLLTGIKERLLEILRNGVPIDELVSIVNAVDASMKNTLTGELEEEFNAAVWYEFGETKDAISHLDTHQDLSEHLEHLESLAKVTGFNSDDAKQIVSDRMSELDEPDYSDHHISVPHVKSRFDREFSDEELHSLFSSLVGER